MFDAFMPAVAADMNCAVPNGSRPALGSLDGARSALVLRSGAPDFGGIKLPHRSLTVVMLPHLHRRVVGNSDLLERRP
jgi:hypothetical protein